MTKVCIYTQQNEQKTKRKNAIEWIIQHDYYTNRIIFSSFFFFCYEAWLWDVLCLVSLDVLPNSFLFVLAIMLFAFVLSSQKCDEIERL